MPLEAFKRGKNWWVRGRVEYNGTPISGYVRTSTGALTEAGARGWIQAAEERAIRRHILGDEAAGLTMNEAVMLYEAKPAEARFLLPIIERIGTKLVTEIAPADVRALAREIYPHASTDTWKRQVVVPVSAVINNAHDKGLGPAIRIKGYSTRERIEQDARRGKQSRAERKPGSWEWIAAVKPHANPYLGAGLEMMLETGIRIGQLVAITPKDCDLQTARVWIIAQNGHPAQWVQISMDMVVTLANLPPRRPHDRKRGRKLPARVFGYANRTGFTSALRRACEAAGVEYLSPHQAGRHGFYTEAVVRRGEDPVDAAKHGRWSNVALPLQTYAHSQTSEAEFRARIRTNRVQAETQKSAKRIEPK